MRKKILSLNPNIRTLRLQCAKLSYAMKVLVWIWRNGISHTWERGNFRKYILQLNPLRALQLWNSLPTLAYCGLNLLTFQPHCKYLYSSMHFLGGVGELYEKASRICEFINVFRQRSKLLPIFSKLVFMLPYWISHILHSWF